MEYPKKEIIKEITDLFEDYEETYVPGEWEAFSARKKKKYPFYIQLMSAAAAVLLISSVIFFGVRKDVVKKKETVQLNTVKPVLPENMPAPHKSDPVVSGLPADASQYGLRSAVKGTGAKAGQHPSFITARSAAVKPEEKIKKNFPAEVNAQTAGELAVTHREGGKESDFYHGYVNPDSVVKSQQNQAVAKVIVKPAVTDPAIAQKEVKPKREKLSMMDFLAQESKAAEKAAKRKDNRSKWDFGLQVMPVSTGSNVDLGGGITTAYRISDKFSLSSGVSLLQLQAGKDVPPAPQQVSYALNSLSLSPDKKLTGVATNLRAIDIPVGIIYKVNQHFYTSVGVSLFNVLSEKRSNTYVQTAQVDQMAVNPETGFVSTYKSLQTTEVMEKVMPGTSGAGEDPVRKNNSMGFFNFSIGRQQNIFNKYSIQIEPFIKVPLGKFSSENLNLLNSGVKFQVSF